jgi:hypothetical protein
MGGGCLLGDVVSSHSLRAGVLQVVSPRTGLTGQVQHDYGNNSKYRLKLSCWHTHGLQAHGTPPVHYFVLPDDVLWLIGYVL